MKKFALAVAMMVAGAAQAQELTIGVQADPSMDPHFMYVGTNVAIWKHMFGSLTVTDDAGLPQPSVAESYKLTDDRTWEFRLRPGVKFSDGSPLTAEDVVFSLRRVPDVPRNPSQYTPRLETITSVEAVDAGTVRIRTAVPNPRVPENMTNVAIVSKKAAEGQTTADFTSGKATIGSGPYKFVQFVPGDRLVVERNPHYWGPKPHWERVTFKVITNNAARVAALLSGDVDLIEFVPPTDLVKLRSNPQIAVYEGPSGRVICFVFNFRDGPLPTITDAQGKPLAKNPLQDKRVRQAISKAIDREAIVARIMDGAAIPANQMAMPGIEGFDPTLPPAKYDPDGAKALLKEAGYPQGFTLTISCPNNRYVNDERICQAVGQMLSRAGLRVVVDTAPMSVFMTKLRGAPNEPTVTPMGMLGLGNGQYAGALPFMAHSAKPEVARGQYNFTGYANDELDKLIDDAMTTMDEGQRSARMQQAMRRVTEDMILLPIHFQKTVVASRRTLTYTVNTWEETLAWKAMPRQ